MMNPMLARASRSRRKRIQMSSQYPRALIAASSPTAAVGSRALRPARRDQARGRRKAVELVEAAAHEGRDPNAQSDKPRKEPLAIAALDER